MTTPSSSRHREPSIATRDTHEAQQTLSHLQRGIACLLQEEGKQSRQEVAPSPPSMLWVLGD